MHDGNAFEGSANRYYRSNTVGLYVNDNFKVRSNLTVTVGLRWDFDGPLSEKYGRLTAFDPSKYSYVQYCEVQGDPAPRPVILARMSSPTPDWKLPGITRRPPRRVPVIR